MTSAFYVRIARNARWLIMFFAALLLSASLLATSLALGGGQTLTDDYGIISIGQLAMYECEDGETWVPSATNINGECVPE